MLEWGSGAAGKRLRDRIRAIPQDEVVTTIISFEEQTRGWLAFQARARTLEQQVNAYRKLKNHLDVYSSLIVLEFDAQSAAEFQRLKQAQIRIGTMDLKIAAITQRLGSLSGAAGHSARLYRRHILDPGSQSHRLQSTNTLQCDVLLHLRRYLPRSTFARKRTSHGLNGFNLRNPRNPRLNLSDFGRSVIGQRGYLLV